MSLQKNQPSVKYINYDYTNEFLLRIGGCWLDVIVSFQKRIPTHTFDAEERVKTCSIVSSSIVELILKYNNTIDALKSECDLIIHYSKATLLPGVHELELTPFFETLSTLEHTNLKSSFWCYLIDNLQKSVDDSIYIEYIGGSFLTYNRSIDEFNVNNFTKVDALINTGALCKMEKVDNFYIFIRAIGCDSLVKSLFNLQCPDHIGRLSNIHLSIAEGRAARVKVLTHITVSRVGVCSKKDSNKNQYLFNKTSVPRSSLMFRKGPGPSPKWHEFTVFGS